MQTIRTPRSKGERYPAYVAMLALALAITACSDSDDDGVSTSNDIEFLPADDDPVTPIPDESVVDPMDPDGDDAPGLVVDGLSGGSPDQYFTPWHVWIDSFLRADAPGDLHVDALGYERSLSASEYIENYTTIFDTCELLDIETDGADDGDDEPREFQFLDAGDTLTINTPSGPWFSVARSEFDDREYHYFTEDTVPGPFPDSATLALPGADFPGVSGYPLASPDAPVRLSPAAGATVTGPIVARWVPAEGATGVELDLAAYRGDEFVGFPALCRVENDGVFALPDDVLTHLEGFADLDVYLRMGSLAYRLDFRDGIVFFHAIEVAEAASEWRFGRARRAPAERAPAGPDTIGPPVD